MYIVSDLYQSRHVSDFYNLKQMVASWYDDCSRNLPDKTEMLQAKNETQLLKALSDFEFVLANNLGYPDKETAGFSLEFTCLDSLCEV